MPLREHSEEALRGYMMLVFLSIIVFVMIRQKLPEGYTFERALLILRGLKAKVYQSEIIPLEVNKKSREIFAALGTKVHTSLGI